jgi:hypothetical protein
MIYTRDGYDWHPGGMEKKYYEVYLEPMEAEFMGVVEATDQDDAEEKVSDDKYTQDFKFAPEQRGFELREITQKGYQKLVAHLSRKSW